MTLEYMIEMQKKAKSEMENFGLDYTSVQSAIASMYRMSPAEIQIIGFNVEGNSILYRHGANDTATIPISEVTSKDVK
jgi:hypothetical protein